MPVKIKDRESHFWSKVDKSGDCWEWQGGVSACGYGMFWNGEKQVSAHRTALLFEGLDIPSGMCVLHTCDNRICVNPDHLWLGTHKDNAIDMVNKGRHYDRRGERCPTAKLTESQAREIKVDSRKHGAIAKDYGLAQSTVTRIKNGKRWAHL